MKLAKLIDLFTGKRLKLIEKKLQLMEKEMDLLKKTNRKLNFSVHLLMQKQIGTADSQTQEAKNFDKIKMIA